MREEGEGWNAELWVTWNPKRKNAAVESRFRFAKDALIKVVELNWRDNPKFPAKLERERLRWWYEKNGRPIRSHGCAYAQGWVRSRHGTRGLGKRAVAQELRRKGVADDVIAEALDPIDPEQERARAYELARSRYPQVMGLPYATQVRRLMGALTRRGYDVGVASAVVREVISSEPDEMPVV